MGPKPVPKLVDPLPAEGHRWRPGERLRFRTSGNIRTILVGVPVLLGLYVIGRQPNPFFHSLAELFSAVIAYGIFMMAWNSRRYQDNNSLLFIGVAYLSVGSLDLMHALAYNAHYVSSGYVGNTPGQLWVAARLIQGVSLLAAPLLVKRSLNATGLISAYISITAFVLLAVFYWDIFPDCYLEGRGLTPFQRISEYLVAGTLFSALFAFVKFRQQFDSHVFRQIVLSIVFTIASDLAFTFYARGDDGVFVLGHVFKVIAFYFIYDAIIATGIAKPYDLLVRNLKLSETSLHNTVHELTKVRLELESRVQERTKELTKRTESLQREMEGRKRIETALRESETKYRIVADNTRDWEWWLGSDRRFIYVSPSCKQITGYDASAFLSDDELVYKIIHPEDRQKMVDHVNEADRDLVGGEVEFRIIRPDGSERYMAHACSPVFNSEGSFLGHRGSNRDITDRKMAEIALQESATVLRLLSSQLLTAQEDERKRVARELHDGINQTLSAIKFSLETRLAHMDGSKAPDGVSLERIISMVHTGIEEARRLQMDLRPPMLDDLGIVATLKWFTREFREVYNHIRLEMAVDLNEDDVPDALKVELFRIVQESLNNIAKHSYADSVSLLLKRNNGCLELRVADNGVGFDVGTVERGVGIASMKERAELSSGSLHVRSVPGEGSTVAASWPIGQ